MTGLIYCSIMMFMGVAAVNSQANLLFGVFGLMIGILIVSFALTRVGLRKIAVTRLIPEYAVVGTPAAMRYEIRNDKRFWPTISVVIAELDGVETFTRQPQAYMLHAAAGMSAIVPVDFVPRRRGLYHLDCFQISTSFPFGFVKRAFDRRFREAILVYPAIGRVDPKLLQICRSAESNGPTMRPRRGGTDEFYGLKEFRSGESARMIYWRRSARTGTLVSKEMTHVSPPRLMLLVDTHLPDRTPASHAAVERCIAMAGSLASHALETGLPVGLLMWSHGQWLSMMPNRGKRQRRDLLTELARLDLNTDKPLSRLLEASHEFQKSDTTMIVFTPTEMRVGLTEVVHGKTVVINPNSAQSQNWFRFAEAVDFENCMPPEQEKDDKVTR